MVLFDLVQATAFDDDELKKTKVTHTACMPLLIVSGFPCGGKTTRAKQIESYLLQKYSNSQENQDGIVVEPFQSSSTSSSFGKKTSAKHYKVIRIDEPFLQFDDRKTTYSNATEEKKARGALLSAVERYLSKNVIVICDGMNYIKGFRYQLYCIAKGLNTPSCLLHCGVPNELAQQYNNTLLSDPSTSQQAYDPVHFDELIMRYEEPDPKNRWDSPCFTVLADDPDLTTFVASNENTAHIPWVEQLAHALLLSKAPTPNFATIVKPLTEPNYLFQLDKITQDIMNLMLQAQREGLSSSIQIPQSSTCRIQLPHRTVSLPELSRIRKQFIQLNKLHTSIGTDKIAERFVLFLNTTLNNE